MRNPATAPSPSAAILTQRATDGVIVPWHGVIERVLSTYYHQEEEDRNRDAQHSHFLSLSLTFSHFLSLSLTFSHFLSLSPSFSLSLSRFFFKNIFTINRNNWLSFVVCTIAAIDRCGETSLSLSLSLFLFLFLSSSLSSWCVSEGFVCVCVGCRTSVAACEEEEDEGLGHPPWWTHAPSSPKNSGRCVHIRWKKTPFCLSSAVFHSSRFAHFLWFSLCLSF
jgi:hypothetical protein